jgi:hypothetical protein
MRGRFGGFICPSLNNELWTWTPELVANQLQVLPAEHLGFALLSDGMVGAFAPDWFLVGLCGAIAPLAWINRFSLRTLIIATTLVAVLLGLIVWASN